MQIIIVVESDKESKSDYIYINHIIKSIYNLNGNNIKLTPLYAKGKGNCINKNAKINENKKKYPHGESKVLVCIDLDESSPINDELNKRIENHCKRYGYILIKFNEDIEDVFLERKIVHSEKTDEAKRYIRISNIDVTSHIVSKLNCTGELKKQTSNLIFELEKILGHIKKAEYI